MKNQRNEKFKVIYLLNIFPTAFQLLQSALPAVPPSTKLSKLDVLLMASAYIAHLGRLVEDKEFITSEHHLTFHPVKVIDSTDVIN